MEIESLRLDLYLLKEHRTTEKTRTRTSQKKKKKPETKKNPPFTKKI